MPVIMPNIIVVGQTVYEKSIAIFLHPSLFWCPRGTPWAKVHQSGWWCIARPPLSSCQILSPSDHPSTRYLLPKLVDFIDCVSDKKRQTVNIIVPALPCGENNNKQVNVYSSSCYPLSPYKAYYINVILLPNTLTWLGHVVDNNLVQNRECWNWDRWKATKGLV